MPDDTARCQSVASLHQQFERENGTSASPEESCDRVLFSLVESEPGTFYGTTRPDIGGGDVYRLHVLPQVQNLAVDVKPGSCANPLNVRSNGVLPVAVLGTSDLDVSGIDPATLRLNGVAPLRWAVQDVGTAADNDDGAVGADCAAGWDGHPDLILKFATPSIAATLTSSHATGETYTLKLTGNLKSEYGGTAIEGEDSVVLVGGPRASSEAHRNGAVRITGEAPGKTLNGVTKIDGASSGRARRKSM